MGARQNSNSNLNPNFAGFHGTAASGTGSQDSGIETIENPYSRAGKRRMMPRPPTQSGQPNDAHMQSVGSQQQLRPMTGPGRPPLKNASSPLINQDLQSDYMNQHYNGSQGSQLGGAVQPSNFNFAPPPRTAGHVPTSGFGATNILSEADFERANTDIEDNDDESYYEEEEVTDEEAMEKQKKENATDSDDSDMGFYMPSIIQKTGDTPPRSKKQEKITKKVSKKKKKTTSSKKPPRRASPTLGKPNINV